MKYEHRSSFNLRRGFGNFFKNFIFDSVRNCVKLGVFLMILYSVVDNGFGLGVSLGDCRPALPKGRKYQMVKTQTESHNRRLIV
jgi:hypothetical protein